MSRSSRLTPPSQLKFLLLLSLLLIGGIGFMLPLPQLLGTEFDLGKASQFGSYWSGLGSLFVSALALYLVFVTYRQQVSATELALRQASMQHRVAEQQRADQTFFQALAMLKDAIKQDYAWRTDSSKLDNEVLASGDRDFMTLRKAEMILEQRYARNYAPREGSLEEAYVQFEGAYRMTLSLSLETLDLVANSPLEPRKYEAFFNAVVPPFWRRQLLYMLCYQAEHRILTLDLAPWDKFDFITGAARTKLKDEYHHLLLTYCPEQGR